MFQTCPVKIMRMHASSSPTFVRGKRATIPRTSPGRKPRTGMPCPMSSRGMRTFSARFPAPRRPVDEREDEGEQVRREAAGEREQRVAGEGRGERSISTVGRIGASHRWASATTPATSAPTKTRIRRSTAAPGVPAAVLRTLEVGARSPRRRLRLPVEPSGSGTGAPDPGSRCGSPARGRRPARGRIARTSGDSTPSATVFTPSPRQMSAMPRTKTRFSFSRGRSRT